MTSAETRRFRLRLGIVIPLLVAATAASGQDDPVESVIAPLADQKLLLDATTVDGLTVAVGTRGIVLLSEDAGASWRQVATPTRSMLTGVHFADRRNGWAVGHDAVIISTADGGETWQRVYFEPERETPLFDVWFADQQRGIAVGAYGLFLRSVDGGQTWTDEAITVVDPGDTGEDVAEDSSDEDGFWEDDFDGPADFHLNKITEDDDGRLYISAEAGNLYRSDDRGATWVALDTGYEGSFFSALPVPGNGLLAFGLRGSMFRSDDDGKSWRRVDMPAEVLLNEGTVLADGTVVVVGMSGTVLISDDGGASFYLVQREDRKALTQVLPGDGEDVLIFGEAGPVRLAAEDYRRP